MTCFLTVWNSSGDEDDEDDGPTGLNNTDGSCSWRGRFGFVFAILEGMLEQTDETLSMVAGHCL